MGGRDQEGDEREGSFAVGCSDRLPYTPSTLTLAPPRNEDKQDCMHMTCSQCPALPLGIYRSERSSLPHTYVPHLFTLVQVPPPD